MRIRLTFHISVLCLAILVFNIPLVTHAQLFDGEREGLLIGGGLGYTAAAITSEGNILGGFYSVSGFTTTGRIGYGLSDQLTIYFSSPVTDIVPSLGVMYFPDQKSDYYLQGLIGYRSSNLYSLLSIGGGIGYHFHDQITLEGMLGYNRYSYSITTPGYDSWFFSSPAYTTEFDFNILTLAVTFNVYFY